jgi:hypothetical protein
MTSSPEPVAPATIATTRGARLVAPGGAVILSALVANALAADPRSTPADAHREGLADRARFLDSSGAGGREGFARRPSMALIVNDRP